MISSYKVPPFPCQHMNDLGSKSSYNMEWTAAVDKPQTKCPSLFALYGLFKITNSDLNPLVYNTYTLSLKAH